MSDEQPEMIVWFQELCRANLNSRVKLESNEQASVDFTTPAGKKAFLRFEQYGYRMYIHTCVKPLGKHCQVYVEDDIYVVEVMNKLPDSPVRSWKADGVGNHPAYYARDVGRVHQVTWCCFEFNDLDAATIASAKCLLNTLMTVLTKGSDA